MVIYNEDRISSKYISNDTILYEINSSLSLKKVLETLVEVQYKNNSEALADFKEKCVVNVYDNLTGETSTETTFYGEFDEINPEEVPNFDTRYDDYYDEDYDDYYVGRRDVSDIQVQKNALYKKYEAVIFKSEEANIRPLKEEDYVDLINNICCSLGILPNIFEKYPELSTKEAINLTDNVRNTFFEEIAEFFPNDYKKPLPNKANLDIIKNLTKAEKSLFLCSSSIIDYKNPTKVLSEIISYKANTNNALYGGAPQTELRAENANSLYNIAVLENKFKETYGRAPKVLPALCKAYKEKYPNEDIANLVEVFDLSNISKIAKYNNVFLFSLALPKDKEAKEKKEYINFNNLSNEQIEYLGVYGSFAKDRIQVKYDSVVKYINDNKKDITPKLIQKITAGIFDGYIKQSNAEELFQKTPKEIEKCVNTFLELKENDKWLTHDVDISKNILSINGQDKIIENSKYRMYLLDPQDLRNETSGIYTTCCQRFDSVGSSCVKYILTHPLAGNCVIEEKKNGNIVAQGFVWTNPNQSTLVFDNVEFEPKYDNKVRAFNDIFYAFCKEMPFNNIHVGTGYNPGMTGWGKRITISEFLKFRDCLGDGYSDYHSNDARVIKRNNKTLLSSCSEYKVINKDDFYKNRDEFLVDKNEMLKARAENEAFLKEWNMLGFISLWPSFNELCEVISAATTEGNSSYLTPDNISQLMRFSSKKVIEAFIEKHPELFTETEHYALKNRFGTKYYLETVKSPLSEIIYEHILNNPTKLIEIDNPPEDICIEIVKKSGMFVRFIKPEALTENIVNAAICTTPSAVKIIPPSFITQDVINKCINLQPKSALFLLNNINDEQLRETIKAEPSLIEILPNKTPELVEFAIKENPFVVNKLPFNRDYVTLAIQMEPRLIKNYEFKCKDLIPFAIEKDPLIVNSLRKPTQDDFEYAYSVANDDDKNKIRDKAQKFGFYLEEPEVEDSLDMTL